MTQEILIRSSNIRFRRTREEDLKYVMAAEQHPDSKNFIFLWSLEKHLEAIKNQDRLHIMIENLEGQSVGYMILSGLSSTNSCIELIRINITSKGNGYGKQSMKLIQEYLFNGLGVHRIWLDVKEQNKRAIHVYKSVGFKEEGILRECIKTGDRFESLIIMGILRPEYEERCS